MDEVERRVFGVTCFQLECSLVNLDIETIAIRYPSAFDFDTLEVQSHALFRGGPATNPPQ